MKYDSSSTPKAYSNSRVAFGTWPASFGSVTVGAWSFSIYASYTH